MPPKPKRVKTRASRGRTYTPCGGSGMEPDIITRPARTVPSPKGPKAKRAQGRCPECHRIGISLDLSGEKLVPHAPYVPESWHR